MTDRAMAAVLWHHAQDCLPTLRSDLERLAIEAYRTEDAREVATYAEDCPEFRAELRGATVTTIPEWALDGAEVAS